MLTQDARQEIIVTRGAVRPLRLARLFQMLDSATAEVYDRLLLPDDLIWKALAS